MALNRLFVVESGVWEDVCQNCVEHGSLSA